jgi:hypothetical protein
MTPQIRALFPLLFDKNLSATQLERLRCLFTKVTIRFRTLHVQPLCTLSPPRKRTIGFREVYNYTSTIFSVLGHPHISPSSSHYDVYEKACSLSRSWEWLHDCRFHKSPIRNRCPSCSFEDVRNRSLSELWKNIV